MICTNGLDGTERSFESFLISNVIPGFDSQVVSRVIIPRNLVVYILDGR